MPPEGEGSEGAVGRPAIDSVFDLAFVVGVVAVLGVEALHEAEVAVGKDIGAGE